MKKYFTHGSLFSGIGGFDLAAEWAGWKNVFHCEWNDFGKQVLKYYWPNAISYDDITKTDFTIHRGQIDVLSGGFPCQPYSAAGKRLGKEDERHLWPEMLRAIREIQPRYIVGENVYGLVNWNRGMVFDEVQSDLENEWYELAPVILPACAVNAPHRRNRVWFVAYSEGNGSGRTSRKTSSEIKGQNGYKTKQFTECCKVRHAADAERIRSSRKKYGQTQSGQYSQKDSGCGWEDFPTQSPVCRRDDGISARLDGITFPKWRNESIKAYGNAIVPQVAYQIFQVINQM